MEKTSEDRHLLRTVNPQRYENHHNKEFTVHMQKRESTLRYDEDMVMASSSDRFPSTFTGQSQAYRPPFQPPQMQTAFKLDEGYSEETRSQTGSDVAMEPEYMAAVPRSQDPTSLIGLPDWIMTLGEHQRSGTYRSGREKCSFIDEKLTVYSQSLHTPYYGLCRPLLSP